MPAVGPNYFSTSSAAGGSAWTTPSHAEGAPDGLYTTWISGTIPDFLLFTNWQGSVPAGYVLRPNDANFKIELYCFNSSTQTLGVQTRLLKNGTPFGPTSISSISVNTTIQWVTVPLVWDWSSWPPIPFTPYDIGFEISMSASPLPGSSTFEIDTARMTIEYDSDAQVYNLEHRTIFVDQDGNILFETVRP